MIDDYDESSGWMFLLVPAHPGFPGQIPQSRKTVVLCVCVGLELLLGYLATSGAKSDIIFLLSDPDFLKRGRNFSPTSFSFRDLMQDRRQTDATTITEDSHSMRA